DLRIVVMSATLDSGRASAYLDDCPVVDVPGRLFPLDIAYRPAVPVDTTVTELLKTGANDGGSVLCFLAGAGEIRQAQEALRSVASNAGVQVLPLHGSLSGEEQDAAIHPSSQRRIILATNIAETTLTVPDV